jgi:predicted nuclease with TOPRIM domain
MTTELLSVLVAVMAVGVALGGVILTGLHGIRREMGDLRREMGDLRGELSGLRRDMEMRLSAVERQQAKLEGLLEGLREAITGHKAA